MKTKFAFGDLIPTFLPTFFSLITFFLCLVLKFIDTNILGLGDMINSIITFTSIIVGVLIALFGIIVSLSEADIMREIRNRKGEKALFRFCIETLISNFVLLLQSIVFQGLINYKDEKNLTSFVNFFSYIWFSLVVFVLVSSCRTIYYLLMISFNQNNNSIRPTSEKLTQTESKSVRNRYSSKKEKA